MDAQRKAPVLLATKHGDFFPVSQAESDSGKWHGAYGRAPVIMAMGVGGATNMLIGRHKLAPLQTS